MVYIYRPVLSTLAKSGDQAMVEHFLTEEVVVAPVPGIDVPAQVRDSKRLALGFGVFQSILMLFLYLILHCLKNELTHFGSLWHTFSSLDPIVYSCLLGPPRSCERAAGCQSWYADAIVLHVLYLKATSDGPLTAKRDIGWAWSRPW